MKTVHILSSITVLIVLSACSAPQDAGMQMMPQVQIKGASLSSIRAGLSEQCEEKGFFVVDQRDNTVICQKESPMMAQVLFSTPGSDVTSNLRYNIYKTNAGPAKVTAQAWFENQNAYGGIKRTPVTGENQKIQAMLNDLKKRLER